MKSLELIAASAMQNLATVQSSPALPALAPRPSPLENDDVAKMDAAIGQFFRVERKPTYGSVPVRDERGEIFRHEFDVVGYSDSYEPTADVPERLRDAMLRPATRQHLVFHLTRLAAHRRDTRGKEAFAAFLEDVSQDLVGVPEWSVVLACREMRGKNETWYPTTGEIMATIKRHQDKVESILSPKCQQVAHEKRERLAAPKPPVSRHEIPRAKWKIEHYDEWVAEAAGMVETVKGFENGQEKSEEWEKIRADRESSRAEWLNATAKPASCPDNSVSEPQGTDTAQDAENFTTGL